ncbi:MAG: glycosyltransferase family 4 protein [Pseudomonadota bacterium]
MKILFSNTGPWGTGSATVVDAVSMELMRQGHEVKVFFPDAGFESMDMEKYYGNPDVYHIWEFPIRNNSVELYTFPLIITDPHPRNYRHAWTFRNLSIDQLRLYLDDFKARFGRIIEHFEPDIIECQHIWAMDHAVMKLGYPYISCAHHSDQLGFRYDSRMREYAARASQSASYIFAISELVRDEVLELYPISPGKVVVIGNGYDQETFRPRPVNRAELFRQFDLNIPAAAPMVTFAGKLSKTKGVDILLQANRLIQELREVHLVLFGAGDLEDVLDAGKPDQYSLENVHLLGHQTFDVLSKFHNAARLSTLPSRYEGFGIAALEAMGCGTPIVVTRTGGPDLFAVGEVVDKESPEQLAQAIMRVLSLPQEQYSALRKEAHQVAVKYSWRSVVEERLKYYQLVARSEGESLRVSM